jgi:hypothetical protein
MSLHAYHVSRAIEKKDAPFYALIMAAMLKADSDNTAKLKAAWPEVWAELEQRYDAPLGVIPADGDVNMEVLRKQIASLEKAS